MALAAFGLAILAVRLDVWADPELTESIGWIYSGGPEGARGVLSVIAGSVITVAGTTFSITIAALSLASSQFGPRLLRSFIRDTGNQIVLGTFTSTFLYCLMVLRTVRGTEDSSFVPHLAVTIGVALAVANVGVLIYFIHHTAESIQVAHVVDVVGKELNEVLKRLFPEGIGRSQEPSPAEPSGESLLIRSLQTGYVRAIDEHKIMEVAVERNVVIRVIARPGDFVMTSSLLAEIWPSLGVESRQEINSCFDLGPVRTPYQDAEFAFLQLSEIAVRALSPGINDPFTAMMCVDRLAAALSLLDERHLPDRARFDDQGQLRVLADPYDLKRLVDTAFDAILTNARSQPMVIQRIDLQLRTLAGSLQRPELRTAIRSKILAAGRY